MKKLKDYILEYFFLTYLIVLLFLLTIVSIIDYLKQNYYLLYPKFTNSIAWVFLSIFFIIFLFCSFQLIKQYRRKNSQIILNYIVLFAISGLFLLNLIQYRLYLNNPSSYIVDDRIKDYHIKNEILKIDSLISYYKKEQSLCKEVLTKTPSKKFIPKYENYNFAITSPLKSISGNFFMVEENEIYFRLICKDPPPTPIPVSIVSKFNGKTYGYDVLEIVYSNYDIEIVQNKVNKDYFNSLNILSDSIQSDLIKMIINTNISDKQNKIVILSENKKSIVKRGLPIGIFLIDSLKSLFGSYQDYKPLNWIGRIIEIFQILFAFIFTMPLFGEPYILLKKKLLK